MKNFAKRFILYIKKQAGERSAAKKDGRIMKKMKVAVVGYGGMGGWPEGHRGRDGHRA